MKKITILIIVGLVILADQLSKYLAVKHLGVNTPMFLLPVLNLHLTFNHGMAFSLFYDKGVNAPLLLVSLTATIALVVAYFLVKERLRVLQFAYAGILGGAIGNIIDRLRYGAVIDFIDAHINNYHWPVFNVADSCICLGALLLLLNKKTSGVVYEK